MNLFYETSDGRAKLYLGDSRQLPVEDDSIDMIATSPPYWGKRDYGEDVVAVWGGEDGCEHEWLTEKGDLGSIVSHKSPLMSPKKAIYEAKFERADCSLCGAWRGQLGLEPTWQEYISHLCECAEEWWRVLKPTGNLFVNIGDTFAGSGSQGDQTIGGAAYLMPYPQRKASVPKMKLGIPFRLRFALNDMGWVSRGDWIWYKGKDYGSAEYISLAGEHIKAEGKKSKVAMPESVKDRLSASYEFVFHLVKKPKGYWFDLDAVRRPHLPASLERVSRPLSLDPDGPYAHRLDGESMDSCHPAGANPGDVLYIQPERFKEPHYACWPSKLCEMMIKVGCPKEVCPKCGKPRERILQVRYRDNKGNIVEKPTYPDDTREPGHLKTGMLGIGGAFGGDTLRREADTIGWSDCGCGEGFVPGVVVDPFFGGSGRIAKVGLYLGRNVIGVDMKEEYLEMAKKRLLQGVLL